MPPPPVAIITAASKGMGAACARLLDQAQRPPPETPGRLQQSLTNYPSGAAVRCSALVRHQSTSSLYSTAKTTLPSTPPKMRRQPQADERNARRQTEGGKGR